MSLNRVLGGAGLGIAVLCGVVFAAVRMPLLAPLGPGRADDVFLAARATLEDMPSAEAARARVGQAREPAGSRLPVLLSLLDGGEPVARGIGRGATFGEAALDAIAQLRVAAIDPVTLRRGRLKLDRVVGRGFLSHAVAPLFAVGAVPGRDGIGALSTAVPAGEVLMTAEDLTRARLWSGYSPLPALEFALGIDVPRAIRALAQRLGEGPRWRPRATFRFRAEEYLERADAPALPISVGHAAGPAVTRATLSDGARAGGAFLLEHLDAEGRFDYEYYTVEDARVTAGYSIPRHAGAASFLAQLYALDHDPAVRAGAERALDALERMRPPGCAGRDGERLCVGDAEATTVDLGSSALALVAAAEYVRAARPVAPVDRYAAFTEGLAEFLLWMQKPDGDFCHLYSPGGAGRDERTQLLYFSGEAAYALALVLGLGDRIPAALAARARGALDRALEYLTHGAYASFASQFYVGEDHWTCMALDVGWEVLPPDHRARYARFCDAFADFLRRSQMRADDPLVAAQPQLAGAYGITALLAPHCTPVGSRSETLISMWHVARHRGLSPDDPRVARPREQVLDGMRFLLARQIRPELDLGGPHLARDPAASRGAIPMSDVERHVRIDFVQHSCSAMLRALELL